MGTFTEVIGVGSSDRQRFEPVEALVDTGATYTMMPSSLLRDLGITPIETRTFILPMVKAYGAILGRPSFK